MHRSPSPPMTRYYDPVSTTGRPILMFAVEHGLTLDYRGVDLYAGEHLGPVFSAINPNQAVPVLQDGEFRLTETSAILKYLADRVGSPTYPRARQMRARVNEAMAWFNTGLSRDFAYGIVFPQRLPGDRHEDPTEQATTPARSRPHAARLLSMMNDGMIGPNQRFLVGDALTLADFMGLGILTLGEAAQQDYARWPNVSRWLADMKARPSYRQSHEIFQACRVAPAARRQIECV